MLLLNKYNRHLKNKYKDIIKNIKIIGVTGSSGKTSTSFLIYQLLNKLNISTSYIGSYFYIQKNIKKINTKTTNELYNLIYESYQNNIKTIVIELNIEDIIKKTYDSIPFDIILCTNLLNDYKENYGGMANYIKLKKQVLKSLKFNGTVILNIDDPYVYNFQKRNTITLGFDESDYRIDKYNLTNNNTTFSFINKNKTYHINSNLIGKYNIYNLMQAIAVASIYKPISTVVNNIGQLYIPLIYETINYGKGNIIIDQASKIGEIISVINTARLFNEDIYITLMFNENIGLLGDYITRISNKCIIYNDNFKYDLKDMINILDGKIDNYELILNKKDAIIKGLSYIKNGGILLIIGKNDLFIYDIIDNSKKIKLDLVNNL